MTVQTSKITEALEVDDPLALTANYFLSAEDRQFISSQARGMQAHLVRSLLRGQIGTFFKLAPTSAALQPGDCFCSASLESSEEAPELGVRYVTLATPEALELAGVVAGVALVAVNPGGWARGATDGIIGRQITGLATEAHGPVRVSAAGRCERVDAFSEGDFPVGYADQQGNLTLDRSRSVRAANCTLKPGPDLADEDATIQALDGVTFTLPADTLTGNHELVIDPSDIDEDSDSDGNEQRIFSIVREDETEFTYTVKNLGGSTLFVFEGGQKHAADFLVIGGAVVLSGHGDIECTEAEGGGGGTGTGSDFLMNPVDLAATENISLSGHQTVDGVMTTDGMRVACPAQTDPTEVGYYAPSAGAWTRLPDADEPAELRPGRMAYVIQGTLNEKTLAVMTAPVDGVIELGVTELAMGIFRFRPPGYTTVSKDATPVAQQDTLDFHGDDVAVADDTDKTSITIPRVSDGSGGTVPAITGATKVLTSVDGKAATWEDPTGSGDNVTVADEGIDDGGSGGAFDFVGNGVTETWTGFKHQVEVPEVSDTKYGVVPPITGTNKKLKSNDGVTAEWVDDVDGSQWSTPDEWEPYMIAPDTFAGGYGIQVGGYKVADGSYNGDMNAPGRLITEANFDAAGSANGPGSLIISGSFSGDNKLIYRTGGAGHFAIQVASMPLSGHLSDCISVGNRVLFATRDKNSLFVLDGFGNTVSELTNVVASGYGVSALHKCPSGRLLLGVSGSGASTNRVSVSDDAGNTWTPKAALFDGTVLSFASNGTTHICVMKRTGQAAHVIRSTDDGDTWGDITSAIDTGMNEGCVTWNEYHQRFIIYTIAGLFHVSADETGLTWEAPLTAFGVELGLKMGTLTFGVQTGYLFRAFASAGPFIAVIGSWIPSTGGAGDPAFNRQGIVFSADLGVTWSLREFATSTAQATEPDLGLKTIINWNDRFVVGAPGIMYVSNALQTAVGVGAGDGVPADPIEVQNAQLDTEHEIQGVNPPALETKGCSIDFVVPEAGGYEVTWYARHNYLAAAITANDMVLDEGYGDGTGQPLSDFQGVIGFESVAGREITFALKFANEVTSSPYITRRQRITVRRAELVPLPLPSALTYFASETILHLDASDFSSLVLSGSDVAEWTNLVTSVSFAEATNRPTYEATGFHGLPCILANGSSHILTTTEAAVLAALGGDDPDICAIAVVQALDESQAAEGCVFGGFNTGGANTRAVLARSTGESALMRRVNSGGTGLAWGSATPGSWPVEPVVIGFTKVSGDSNDGYTLTNDVIEADGSNDSAGSITCTAASLFARNNSSVSQYFHGRLGELFLFDAAMDFPHLAELVTYLKRKWHIL